MVVPRGLPCAGEDLLDGVRQRLIGVLQEERHLPDLGGGESVAVGGHGGWTDAIFDAGVGFTWGQIGDADAETMRERSPELGGRDGAGFDEGVMAGCTVAGSAVGGVGMGAGLEDVFADSERGLLEVVRVSSLSAAGGWP